jgi:hypothetical protein
MTLGMMLFHTQLRLRSVTKYTVNCHAHHMHLRALCCLCYTNNSMLIKALQRVNDVIGLGSEIARAL